MNKHDHTNNYNFYIQLYCEVHDLNIRTVVSVKEIDSTDGKQLLWAYNEAREKLRRRCAEENVMEQLKEAINNP